MYGGGDKDYNDCNFSINNAIRGVASTVSTVSQTLDIYVPFLGFGDASIWADFSFYGEGSNGELLWKLNNFDFNEQDLASSASFVGTWAFDENVVTFSADGTYTGNFIYKASDACGSGETGIETGKYSYDTTLNMLLGDATTDENGCVGFAKHGLPFAVKVTSINESTLTLQIEYEGTDGQIVSYPATWTRQ